VRIPAIPRAVVSHLPNAGARKSGGSNREGANQMDKYRLPTAEEVIDDPILQSDLRLLLIEVKKKGGITFESDGRDGVRIRERVAEGCRS
jgi:hypothetical protein